MGLLNSDYQEDELRALPVVLLLDTSGSMRWPLGTAKKIDKLNEAVVVMMKKFDELEQSERFIRVTVIEFNDDEHIIGKINDTPKNFLQNFVPLTEGGLTQMGKAIDEAKRILEDSELTPKRWYKPAVILVSDGYPEPPGNADSPIERFIGGGKTAKAQRFAIAIGADLDKNILLKFAGAEKNLLSAENAQDIVKWFEFLSRTVTERASQPNPDNFSISDADVFDEKPDLSRFTRKPSATSGRSRRASNPAAKQDKKDPWDF